MGYVGIYAVLCGLLTVPNVFLGYALDLALGEGPKFRRRDWFIILGPIGTLYFSFRLLSIKFTGFPAAFVYFLPVLALLLLWVM